MQPTSPCPAPTHWWWKEVSVPTSPLLLVVAVRQIFCVFLFSLLVMLPFEIPKLPEDMPVRGFPIVWKLLLLHESLPRKDLHP